VIITRFAASSDVATDSTADLTWEQLVALLTTHDRRPIKDGPGWNPARYKPSCGCGKPACKGMRGHRLKSNAMALSALVFDVDKHVDPGTEHARLLTMPEAAAAVRSLAESGQRAVWHTTHSHSPEKPSLRFVLALSRPVLASEWDRFWYAITSVLDFHIEPSCKDTGRFWYLPACKHESEPASGSFEGDTIDVDEVLAHALDIVPQAERVAHAAVDGELGQITSNKNNALFKLGASLRAVGLGETAIQASLIQTWHERMDQGDYPCPEDEILKIAASVMGTVQVTRDAAGSAVFEQAIAPHLNVTLDKILATSIPQDGEETPAWVIAELEALSSIFAAPEQQALVCVSRPIDEIAADDVPPIETLPTWNLHLDRLLGGGYKSRQLVVVAAPPADGKSALVIHQGLHFAQANPDREVLDFSTELDSQELVARGAGNLLGEHWRDLVGGKLPRHEMIKALSGVKNLRCIGADVMPKDGAAVLRLIANEVFASKMRTGKAPMVIVDYLQHIARGGNDDNMRTRVADVSGKLRAIAQVTGCFMWTVAAVARGLYSGAAKAASGNVTDARHYLTAIKECGDVEYDAATVIYLDVGETVQHQNYRIARLAVAKCRHGEAGFAGARFIGSSGRWEPDDSAVVAMTFKAREDNKKTDQNVEDEKAVLARVQRLVAEGDPKKLESMSVLAATCGFSKTRATIAIQRLLATDKLVFGDGGYYDKHRTWRAKTVVTFPKGLGTPEYVAPAPGEIPIVKPSMAPSELPIGPAAAVQPLRLAFDPSKPIFEPGG